MSAICILHGYMLEGSGSNLWTNSVVRALCRDGRVVHLMCQEPHPERYDYVAQAIRYDDPKQPTIILQREVDCPGKCILHKPFIGPVLPVFVGDKYEEFESSIPVVDMDDDAIEDYIRRNVAVLDRIVSEHGITALHANHAVLMSVVAEKVAAARSIPFAIMPHGSAIEYAVKKDTRIRKLASGAFQAASRIFVIGPEIRRRVMSVFSKVPNIEAKLVDLNLGVDTELFTPLDPVERAGSIGRLVETLGGVPRGKTAEQSAQMRRGLDDSITKEALVELQAKAATYSGKQPDEDCESKLLRVDWEREKIILYLGRLITGKGVQSVVAAMPSILQSAPDSRLLIVGHGPLRESVEAMLHALGSGKRDLFRNIITWGEALEEGSGTEPLIHLQKYMERLEREAGVDDYFRIAQESKIDERVIFTGYLTHPELRYLFPCCDVAVFPSIVHEAGPLVFLEALASGVFPMGLYAGGTAASIDALSRRIPAEALRLMRLRENPEHTVSDIARNVLDALALGRAHADALRSTAEECYQWRAVGRKIVETLEGLSAA